MKFVFTLLSFCISASLVAQQSFLVKGSVDNADLGRAFLQYRIGEDVKFDSVDVIDKRFSFAGTVDEPKIATIWFTATKPGEMVQGQRRHITTIFLENEHVTLTVNRGIPVIGGSRMNDSLQSFARICQPVLDKNDSLYQLQSQFMKNSDRAGLERIQTDLEKADMELRGVYRTVFLRDPSSPIAVYLLNIYTYAGWETDPEDFDSLFAKLPEASRATRYGKELEAKLNTMLAARVGVDAPSFTLPDTAGREVPLSSFKGKYLLIDFWASWCGPCREENPKVVAAYQAYKNKGFEILGVSLDDKKDAWIKAIRKDKLSWTHVSDLKGWNNSVAVQYGIKAIPRNFLLDPTGKIIAKDLRGNDLDKLLAKLLN